MADKMQTFWHNRLSNDETLIATGHRAFNLVYNQALYEMQCDTLNTLLQTHEIDATDKVVLDVGSGLGFFVDYFLMKGAKNVAGLDIAPASIDYLRQTYPQAQFHCVDVGAVPALPVTTLFDIVSVISVLYHIVEEDAFRRALRNICQAVMPGGYLLISGMFKSTWQITAGHVQFRTLDQYQAIFDQFNLQVVDVLPMYYLMNRTFVPFLLPPVLGLKPVIRLLMSIDRRLRNQRTHFGAGLKMLLAKRAAS